jgi:hypothetical protein
MGMGMGMWFRLYVELLHDPKIQRLPPDRFKDLINLWCLCAAHGGVVPSDEDVAFGLRITPQEVATIIKFFIEQGFIDEKRAVTSPLVTCDKNAVTEIQNFRHIHNWNKRQFISDTSAERTRKYRKNKKKGDYEMKRHSDVTCDVTTPSPVTPPDTDTESDTDKKKRKKERVDFVKKIDSPVAAAPSRSFFPEGEAEEAQAPRTPTSPTGRKAAKGSSEKGRVCPEDFKPSDKHYAYGAKFGLSPASVDELCREMIDWSHANGNRQIARKLRWDLTLNGFIRREGEKLNPPKRKFNPRDAIT